MNIKELADQADLAAPWNPLSPLKELQLKKFAELIAAHEREECAKMVDHILKEGGGTYGDAIRARSKT